MTPQTKSGFVNHGGAKIYYEMAGVDLPFVMIHAGEQVLPARVQQSLFLQMESKVQWHVS
jgi:hypothetical protein